MWWELRMPCAWELEESLQWTLAKMGITRVALIHPAQSPDQTELRAWLPQHEWNLEARKALESQLQGLGDPFNLSLAAPEWRERADEDWNESWKSHWRPDPVGSRLLILPAWMEPTKQHGERLLIRLDPGSAFGTGSHPSTRLCLEALAAMPLRGLRVADLGCGSGILGITALKLGATELVACDTDSLAINATEQNSQLNGIGAERLRVAQGSINVLEQLLRGKRSDVLICNILAPVIEQLSPSFDSVLSRQGVGLLSGLLVEQAPELMATLLELGWESELAACQGPWGLLRLRATGQVT